MTAMGRTGTKRLFIKKDGFELQLEREENGAFKAIDPALEFSDDLPSRHEIANRTNIALAKGQELSSSLTVVDSGNKSDVSENLSGSLFVTSPMVGTYYSSPSPDEPEFVKVGDKVEKHSIVCIIEAMKVMNEVKSSITGTVVEILVENGQPVEFGTKLFRIT